MRLFGLGKDKKQQKDEIRVEGFGTMRYLADWYSVDCISVILFGRTFGVTFHAVCEDKEKRIGEKQILACKEFLSMLEEYETKMEQLLLGMLKKYEEKVIAEVLSLQDMYFAEDGSFGISAVLNLEDDELAELGIGPENEFGIALSPEPCLIYSGEEFLTRYGY